MLYVRDILGIKTKKAEAVFSILSEVIQEFEPILKLWIELDDNAQFFALIAKNWQSFIKDQSNDQVLSSFS